MTAAGSKRLRLARLGVHVDLDRAAQVLDDEDDAREAWAATLAAVAAGHEAFVVARLFAVYAGHAQPSLGASHHGASLSTQRDVTEDLVRLAADAYGDSWSTELADMRMAGWDIDAVDLRPDEAAIVVSPPLARRISFSSSGAHGDRPQWRFPALTESF